MYKFICICPSDVFILHELSDCHVYQFCHFNLPLSICIVIDFLFSVCIVAFHFVICVKSHKIGDFYIL